MSAYEARLQVPDEPEKRPNPSMVSLGKLSMGKPASDKADDRAHTSDEPTTARSSKTTPQAGSDALSASVAAGVRP